MNPVGRLSLHLATLGKWITGYRRWRNASSLLIKLAALVGEWLAGLTDPEQADILLERYPGQDVTSYHDVRVN